MRENVALSVALFMSALLIPFVTVLLNPFVGLIVSLVGLARLSARV
jgi:lipopolysaccharide export LptBFGC system permease protein LptF